jgi:hypothetical protein
MGIFASELQVPSGRGHAATAGLGNLKKLEDRVTSILPIRKITAPQDLPV